MGIEKDPIEDIFSTRDRKPGLFAWGLRLVWKLLSVFGSLGVIRKIERVWISWTSGFVYQRWIAAQPSMQSDWVKSESRQSAQDESPKFLVIQRFRVFDLDLIQKSVEAVAAQPYPHWRMHLFFDEMEGIDPRAQLKPIIGEDPRIQIWESSSRGDEPPAMPVWSEGDPSDFVVYLEQKGRLAENALWELAKFASEHPEAEWIYTDEDLVGADGVRHSPWFKPDWSPEMLFSCNYLTPAIIRNRLFLKNQMPLLVPMEGNWKIDPLAWFGEGHLNIVHLPRVLYHRCSRERLQWGDSNQHRRYDCHHLAWVTERLQQAGLQEVGADQLDDGTLHVSWSAPKPRVSIIMPTKDNLAILRKCVQSLMSETEYPDYELLLIDTGSQQRQARAYLRQIASDPAVRVLTYREAFNYSAVNNFAAEHASGSLLLFLNDDIEVIQADWLEELVRWALMPEIGIVGCKLLYPNRLIQHAGIILGLGGHAGHVFLGSPDNYEGLFGSTEWYRNYLAVTGACMMMRKDLFNDLGGFNETYQLVFSDVEICLKAFERGFRILYTPFARLIHHEGQTRGRRMPKSDLIQAFNSFRPYLFQGDPYFNPNLSYARPFPRIRLEREDRVGRVSQIIRRFDG